MRRLGSIYDIEVPTATDFRKKVATAAAGACSTSAVHTLSHQMSHFIEVHQRRYEELHGAKFAAQVQKTIAEIVQRVSYPSEKEKRGFFL